MSKTGEIHADVKRRVTHLADAAIYPGGEHRCVRRVREEVNGEMVAAHLEGHTIGDPPPDVASADEVVSRTVEPIFGDFRIGVNDETVPDDVDASIEYLRGGEVGRALSGS